MGKISRDAAMRKVRPEAVAKYGMKIVESFFQKVLLADGCWDWTAARKSYDDPKNSYGIVCVGSIADNWKIMRAHRLSYELHTGPIPKGMIVCHRCDRPCCVNPTHLFVGTMADNTRDMHEKGRHLAEKGDQASAHRKPECLPRGEDHFRAKLNEKSVLEIRKLHEEGLSNPKIGSRYGVSINCIRSIVIRHNWKHI